MSLDYRVLAALFVLGTAAPPAAADEKPNPNAMSFHAWTSTEGRYFGEGEKSYIFADGDFVEGTPKAFQEFVQQNPVKDPHTTVVLNSPGGDLAAGIELGEMIRKAKLNTTVGSRFPTYIGVSPNVAKNMVPYLTRTSTPPFIGSCYSSCTFAFLGGIHRSVPYASTYGVHRFAFADPKPGTDFADIAQQMSGQLVAYVNEMGVNGEFITEMSKKGPKEINNLSSQRMAELNVITPRWKSDWRIATLNDNSGFYLLGNSTDEWGTHEIAVQCAPKTAQTPPPTGGSPGQKTTQGGGGITLPGGGSTPAPKTSPGGGGFSLPGGASPPGPKGTPGGASPPGPKGTPGGGSTLGPKGAPGGGSPPGPTPSPTPSPGGGGLTQQGAPAAPSETPGESGGGGLRQRNAAAAPPAGEALAGSGLELTFFLDPGTRIGVDGLPAAIEHYALELDQDTLTVDKLVTSPATVSSSTHRLTATISVPAKLLPEIEASEHIGFAFVFNIGANLPVKLLQFEADLDRNQLKSFASTCH